MRLTFNVDDAILKAGYDASMSTGVIQEVVGEISFEEFKESLQKHCVWGIIDDEPVGIIYFDGNCAHISILPKYQGKCGFVVKKALNLALKKYGSLIALIAIGDKKPEIFIKRLGFTKLGQTNDFTLYYRG